MHDACWYKISGQMVLSFEMPFALIPLLKFCNSSKKVGPLKESIYVSSHIRETIHQKKKDKLGYDHGLTMDL